MKKRRILVVALILSMLMQLFTGAYAFEGDYFEIPDGVEPETITDLARMGLVTDIFYDVKGHWAEKTINALAQEGIINGRGDGIFDPDGTVTRAEFVKLLVCAVDAYEENKAEGGFIFADVDPYAWYSPYIACALYDGIIDADSEFGCFFPTSDIIRGDAAIEIASALEIGGLEGCTFGDVTDEKTSKAVSAAVAAKIIVGYDDSTFRPNSTLTRAEAATLIERVMTYHKEMNTPRKSKNTATYSEKVIKLENDGCNKIVSADEATGRLVLGQATEEVKQLSVGDILYTEGDERFPDGGVVMVDEVVSVEGDEVALATSAPTLNDVFSEIDISTYISVVPENYLGGSSAPGVSLMSSVENGNGDLLAFELAGSGSANLLDEKKSFEENGFSGEISVKSDIFCDILYKTDADGVNNASVKLVCETTVDSYLAYENGAKKETEIKLGSFKIRVYGPLVVFADFYLISSAEGEFEVEVKASCNNKFGIYADTDKAYLIKSNKSRATLTADAEGELRSGPSVTLGLGVNCLFETPSLVDMDLSFGLGVSGKTAVEHTIKNSDGSVSYSAHNTVPNENGDVHICDLCIDGETFIYADVDFGVGKDLTDFLKIDEIRRGEEFKTKIDDWYYSVSSQTGNKFGYGICPNLFGQIYAVQNPSDCKVNTGDTIVLNASFGIGEDGARPETHPIFYKWYKNNTEILGETGETLVIYNASENNEGHYYCLAYYWELGEELLSAKSRIAQVEVAEPDNGLGGYFDMDETVPLTLCVEEDASPFWRYSGRYAYQWYKNGSLIPGATEKTYHVDSLTVYDGGTYYCVISAGNEEKTSPSFIVEVFRQPAPDGTYQYCGADGIVRTGYKDW